MKLIIRADDLGISEAVNYGIYKAANDGIVTCTGLMPNMYAAEHGYNLVKEIPKLIVGQHTNLCLGKPVSDPNDIPSLVSEETQEFYTSSEIRKREVDTIVLEEAILEVENQLKRFKEITGMMPKYFEGHAIMSNNFWKALEYVADKYDLFYCNPLDENWCKQTGIKGAKWAPLDDKGLYDPISYLINDKGEIMNSECGLAVFHPGYIDQYLLDKSSFTLIRPKEVQALCSEEIKQWIKESNIILCNFENYNN